MTIVAYAHPFVIGVDTHARTHTLAVLVARRTGGDLATLWVIEGNAAVSSEGTTPCSARASATPPLRTPT